MKLFLLEMFSVIISVGLICALLGYWIVVPWLILGTHAAILGMLVLVYWFMTKPNGGHTANIGILMYCLWVFIGSFGLWVGFLWP